ncbi:hypothetical protein K437DRAFT_266030 [Tilletiaria anomala UBC 951]|uniref:SH3 domain-containing protein n=1 Tax=Tilletiaria anomala (strain ATCC 24038 / CBS 436.72 / UBC 951) TaxID=1037660 RepID=A0A066WH01_TILAU|nr:uncharacterized protein K437DRAFT_266030 [Tilletiaria anomala UBC 951]KDN53096.1 hypothetical protein K437DRAFT_266030 [Tilletiaria anomala UBC 951]
MAQQSNEGQTCVSLKGSQQCPSFQDAYINPQNLSEAWPWISGVTDVQSFDEQFDQYFSDPTRYHATKFQRQLQCNSTNANNAALQYQRTILCGQFSQISYSAGCNIANKADPIMVCRDTCFQYSNSESSLINNPQICSPNDALTSTQKQTRTYNLRKDFAACTDWTSLTSTNNQTCVLGIENEGNCGWGPEVNNQLCEYCDPSGNKPVSPCCYDSKTDLSQCSMFGHPLAAAIRPTMSVQTNIGASATSVVPSSTNAAAASSGDATQSGLSGGQLAGVIVGSVVGALLLGVLLAALVFARRRRSRDPEKITSAAGAGGAIYTHNEPSEKAGVSGWKASTDTGNASSPPQKMLSSDGGPSPFGAAAGGAGVGVAEGAIGVGAAAAGSKDSEDRPLSQMSNATSSDGRGTTVPMVKDQYSGHEIRPQDTVVAIYPYTASLNDELTLEPDDVVTVVRLYDDGWALGKMSNGQEGAFPMVCVTSSKGDAPRTSDDGGYTSQGGVTTSSMDGAVTADEGFTSDARSARSR